MNSDFLNKDQTTQIKGFLAILVVMFHNMNYLLVFDGCGYWAVAVFFFLSGYILEQNASNTTVTCRFIIKKLLNIILPYSLMAVVYHYIFAVYPAEYDYSSFINSIKAYAWFDPVVHPGWYVEVLIIMMGIYFISHKISNKNSIKFLVCFLILYSVFASYVFFGLHSNWILRTPYTFLMGVMFARYNINNKFLAVYEKKGKNVWATLLAISLILSTLGVTSPDSRESIYRYPVYFIAPALVVLLNAKMRFNSDALRFIGKYSFWIYMFHIGFAYYVGHLIRPIPYDQTTEAFFFTFICSLLFAIIIDFIYKHTINPLRKKLNI